MIMTAPRSNNFRGNNPMFRRLVRRLLFANRGRLFVILLALSAGAAVSAALLNLQADAKRRIVEDFRSFGANALIMPRGELGDLNQTISSSVFLGIPVLSEAGEVTKVGFSYALVSVSVEGKTSTEGASTKPSKAIVVGLDGKDVQRVLPSNYVATADRVRGDVRVCRVGSKLASQLEIQPRDFLQLQTDQAKTRCYVSTIESFGGSEDSQIFTGWSTVASLADPPIRTSLIQLNVPGSPRQIESYLSSLQQKLPEVEVRPLRQFTEAQSKIYSRISGLLTAATGIILTLTVLCVMAAMTNIAAERKTDVGMMKAIGGSARSILNLFLTEAALLGLAGGLIGAAAGIALSIVLGKAVFGVAAAPRLIVYPISVALTVIVAILGAYPLRRLANVRPATIFRGEA
jgi:putative ABC transport system permease protein